MTEMGWKHGNIRMLNLGLWKVKAKYLYEWTRLTRSCGRLQKDSSAFTISLCICISSY